jgi:hypothetical protein
MSTEPNACLSCCNEFSGAIELCPVCSFARVSRVRLSPGASSASQDTVKLTTLEKSLRLFEHYELVTGKDGKPVELGRGSMGLTYVVSFAHCLLKWPLPRNPSRKEIR